DKWESSPRWPMGTPTPLYLSGSNSAAFERPVASGHDDYLSDPATPVPFLPRPINMGDSEQWHSWLVRDQRFVDGRPDVISYTTEPLTKPLHIIAPPEGALFAANSG